jgi:REP element-mobilizing transposase RayT
MVLDSADKVLQSPLRPRALRVEYAGAMYHVMSRGDQRDDIFLDNVDRHDFIKTLAEACQKTGWQVHAFCLPVHPEPGP